MPLRPHPDVIARRVGTGAVLVHLNTNHVFELNETGRRVWELLGAGVAPELLSAAILDEFEGDPARVDAEVQGLLARLKERGLLA